MALCFSFSVFFIVYPLLTETENRMLYTVISTCAAFILVYLLYSILYILSTAASGACLIGLSLATTDLIKPDYLDAITIALCIIGAICQFAQFYGTRKRSKMKQRNEYEDNDD